MRFRTGFALPVEPAWAKSRIMQWLYLDPNQQQVAVEEEQLGTLVQNGSIQADTMLWNETMTDWQSAQSIWPDTFQSAPAPATVKRPAGAGNPPTLKPRGKRATAKRPSRPATKGAVGSTTGKLTKTAPGAKTGKLAKPTPGSRTRAGRGADEEIDEEVAGATRKTANHLHNYHGWVMAVAVMAMVFGSLVVCGGIAAMVGAPGVLPAIPIILGALPIAVSVLLLKAAGSAKLAVETGDPQALNECLEQLGKYFLGIGIFLLILLIIVVAGIAIAIFSPDLFVPGA